MLVKRERGAAFPGQNHGCPRNCKRRALSILATDALLYRVRREGRSGAFEPRARRPAGTSRPSYPRGARWERKIAAAADVQPIGSYVRNARGDKGSLKSSNRMPGK